MFQIRVIIALIASVLLATNEHGGWSFERFGMASGEILVNTFGIAIPSHTPVKLIQKEILIMLELAVPEEAHKALISARSLLDMAHNKSDGYAYKKIPILRIEAIRTSINHLNTTHSSLSARTKRGWFDAVGQFLKFTTGVATENDIGILKSQFMSNHKNLDISINKIILNNNVLSDAMKKLVNASIIQKNLLLTTINRDVLWHRLSNTIGLASDLVQVAATLSLQYKWLVDQLKSGILPKTVLNKKIISTILKQNVDSFDQNFISVSPTDKIHKFVVKVPIISNETFTLYEVTPCPVKEKTDKTLIIINKYERFVGISNHSYFATNKKPDCILSSSNIQYALCSLNIKLFNHKIQSCSRDIILNKTEPNCRLTRYYGNGKFFIEEINESYIIKFFDFTKITVTCGNKKSYRNLKGIVVLNPPCLLQSALLTVITDNKIYAKQQVKISSWDTSQFFDSSLQTEEVFFSNEEINKINVLNKTLEETLKINITDIKNKNLLWKATTETHIKINYSIMAGIILLVSMVALYFAIRKSREMLKPLEAEKFCCVHPINNK